MSDKKEKGAVHTAFVCSFLLFVLLFSNLTNNLVPSELGGPQTPLEEAAAAAGMPQVSRKDEQLGEVGSGWLLVPSVCSLQNAGT